MIYRDIGGREFWDSVVDTIVQLGSSLARVFNGGGGSNRVSDEYGTGRKLCRRMHGKVKLWKKGQNTYRLRRRSWRYHESQRRHSSQRSCNSRCGGLKWRREGFERRRKKRGAETKRKTKGGEKLITRWSTTKNWKCWTNYESDFCGGGGDIVEEEPRRQKAEELTWHCGEAMAAREHRSESS